MGFEFSFFLVIWSSLAAGTALVFATTMAKWWSMQRASLLRNYWTVFLILRMQCLLSAPRNVSREPDMKMVLRAKRIARKLVLEKFICPILYYHWANVSAAATSLPEHQPPYIVDR